MARAAGSSITGISDHWATELARRLERDPTVEFIAGIDSEPPAADLERTEFIEADLRSPLISRLMPGDRARHGRPLRDRLVPGARQAGAGASRHQRDRLAAAPRRLREGPDAASASSSAARRRSTAARARRRSFFTEDMARKLPAADPLPARHRRARELLRELLAPPARRHLHDAALPARDRRRARHAARPLPLAAGGPDPARLRPAAPARPRRGRDRRAAWRRSRTRFAAPVNVAPTGSISLSRLLRLAGRPPVPIPHPALRPGALAPRPPRARGRRGLQRRAAPAALRPRGRQHAACARRSASSRASTPSARRGTSPRRRGAAGIVPLPGLGALAGRSAEAGDERARADPDRRRRGAEAIADFLRSLGGGVERGPRPDRRRRARRRRACRRACATRSSGPRGGCAATTTRTSGGSTRSSPRRSSRSSSSSTTSGGGSRPTALQQRSLARPRADRLQPRRLALPVRRLDDHRRRS